MTDDFRRYEAMRDAGADPQAVYRSAKADGLDWVTRIRLIRRLFDLSLVEAKEVGVIADGLAASLEQYQERFIEPVQEALSISVEERVIAILRDQLGIPEDRLTPDLFIMGEIDSPDHVELIMELEEEFDISIPDADAERIQTVAQAIRYVMEHVGRADASQAKADMPKPPAGPLWDRELDG